MYLLLVAEITGTQQMSGKKMSGYGPHHDDSEIVEKIDLASAVSQLPKRQQVVLALRCLGWTQQSITQLLGISRTTVWADEREALGSISDFYGKSAIEDGEETSIV